MKFGLWTKSSLAALVAAGVSAPIGAAQAQIDEVIVTAQKREENLQEVPISITTLPGERLQQFLANGEDIRALAGRIPGLNAESSNGRVAPRFYIRGLGNTDFDLAASQPVSIIMDEVVMENVILKSFPLFDIEQVEVLRGPQGTLFGRNTTAGIVKFDTRKPTEEYTANAAVTYGRFDTFNAEAAVGGAIIPGLLSTRASFLYQSRQDWIDNGFTGQNDALGGFEEIAGRLQFLLTPSDDLSALVNVHGRTLEGTASVFRANIFDTGSNELNSNFDRDRVFFDQGDNNPQEYDSWGGSIKLDYDLGPLTFTSISAYEAAEGFSLGDIDGGFGAVFLPESGPGFIPFPSQTQDSIDELSQFTQEIRIASNYDGPVNFQLGGYFFDSEFEVSTVDPNPAGFPPRATLNHENQLWAVFFQSSYDVTDLLTVSGGVRYTDDEKDLTTLASPIAGVVDPVNVQDDQLSWDVNATYAATDSVNVYARIARGFRGPTIQGRDVAFGGQPSVAQSETNLSFEGGIKSTLLDNRARLNLSGFYYTVDDIQVSAVGGTGNLIQLVNADEAVGWGFEADAEFAPFDNILVTGGLAYANTEIQDSDLAVGVCGSGLCTPTDPLDGNGFALVDGNPLPQAPEWTFNMTARYGIPVSPVGEIYLFTDWVYQSSYNFLLYEAVEFQTDGQIEGAARLGYVHNDGQFEFAVFARNITDEQNVKGVIDFNNLTGFVNEPRIWGISISAAL